MSNKKQSEHGFEWSQISAFRLMRHHFVDQVRADLTTVSRNVCGIQSQLLAAAEMALWARLHKLSRTDIHSALWERRTLVKTSSMRGTLHLLPATDFTVYVNALKRSRVRAMRQIMSRYGVTQKEADAVTDTVVESLAAGPMTRRELTERVISLEIVGEKAKAWFEQGWWGVVRQAMVEGFICYGPDRGQEATFVRVDQWLPGQRDIDELEAQQILLRRYLRAFGPAAPQDFSKWTGNSMKEVRAVWESLEEEVVEVDIEDQKGFILRQDYDQLANSYLGDQILRLLPSFDPYLLGHVDKHHFVSANVYKRVYRKAGWISPVVLLNGRVIGIWTYSRRGKRLTLEIESFEKLSGMIRTKIEEEAASLGGFLETSWEITFSQ